MQEQRPPVRVERVAGSNRSLAILIVMVNLGLLVLVAKPWGGTASRPPPSLPTPFAAPPAATVAPSLIQPTPNAELAAAEGRRQCFNPAVWRLVTAERTGSMETRSLFPINPVVARGPTDPSIMAATIYAAQLLGLGYCVPVSLDPNVSATENQVLIWTQLSSGSYTAINSTRILDPGLFDLGEAYLAPPTGPWPGGRYVFEIQRAAPDGTARWFALDFAPID